MSNFSVEEAVTQALNGNKEAMNELIESLAPTVESIASAYIGRSPLTRSDLIQEGMIGLLSSVYGFDAQSGTRFTTYASTCISNRIKSAVRNQLRNKHAPLNGYVLIDDVDINDARTEPETILEMQEKMDRLNYSFEHTLSELERNVMKLHIAGFSYSSIARELGLTEKAVANALQRARKKLKEN